MPEEIGVGATPSAVEEKNATSSPAAVSSPDLSGEDGDVCGSFVLIHAGDRRVAPKEISVGDGNGGNDYDKGDVGRGENLGEALEREEKLKKVSELGVEGGVKIENMDELEVNGEEGTTNGETLGVNVVRNDGEGMLQGETTVSNIEWGVSGGLHGGEENVKYKFVVEASGLQGEEGVANREGVEVGGLNREEEKFENREEVEVSGSNGEQENVEDRKEANVSGLHGGEGNFGNSKVEINGLQGQEAVANSEELEVRGLNREEENVRNREELGVSGLNGDQEGNVENEMQVEENGLQSEENISDSKEVEVNGLRGSEEDAGDREELAVSGSDDGEKSADNDKEVEMSGLQGEESTANDKKVEVSEFHIDEGNVENREEMEVNELHDGKERVENSEEPKMDRIHRGEESLKENIKLVKDDRLHEEVHLGDENAKQKNSPISAEEGERKKNICVEAAKSVGENRSLPSEEDEMKVEKAGEGGDACVLSINQESYSGVDEGLIEFREPADHTKQCGKEDAGVDVVEAVEERELQASHFDSELTAAPLMTNAVEGAGVEETLRMASYSKQEEDAESELRSRTEEEMVIDSGEHQLQSATEVKGESEEEVRTEKTTGLVVEPENKLQSKIEVAYHAVETETGVESETVSVAEGAKDQLDSPFLQENPEIVDKEISIEMDKADAADVGCLDVDPEKMICEGKNKSSALAGNTSQPPDSGSSERVETSCNLHHRDEAKDDELVVEALNSDADGSLKPEHVQDSDKKIAQRAEPSDGIQDAAEDPSSSSSDKEKRDVYVILIHKLNKEYDQEKSILQADLNEKTAARDAANTSWKAQKVTVSEHQQKWEAAKREENLARTRFSGKRKEMDNLQAILGRMKNASFIDDIEDKIQNMELMIQHETMPLKQEKQYLKEIKLLKSRREELSSNMGLMEDIQEAFEQRDAIEERLKEADSFKDELLLAEKATKNAWKDLFDERQALKDLQNQYQAAARAREEAYARFRKLSSEFYALKQQFYSVSDYRIAVDKFRAAKDIEGLQNYCNNQVENVMEMWNNNKEFRKLYVKSNEAKTIRRLGTPDGRSLGLNEKPPMLQTAADPISGPELEKAPVEVESMSKKSNDGVKNKNGEPASGITHPNHESKSKKSKKLSCANNLQAVVPIIEDAEEVEEVVGKKLSKEEEELARKEEELRKEKAAAELKEQLRLEQIAKAKEAEERKRRKAERNQAKAEFKAKKEAEEKEMKKGKKEKKKAVISELETVSDAPGAEASLPVAVHEPESKPTTFSKRALRSVPISKKYSKAEPLPPQLRNRNKRKTQAWMWALIVCLLLVVLFSIGNYISSSTLPHQTLASNHD